MQALQLDTGDRELVVESDHITVWCSPKSRLVYHEMHKPCYGAPFREALSAGVRAMQQHRADSWLSDDRLNGPLPENDEHWGMTTWFQQAKAAGWKYWAMVMPERAVGKLNVKRLVEMYRKRSIEAQMFTEPVPALNWLCEVRAKPR